MMLVTLEAVAGVHVAGMSVVATQTVEFFPVAWVTLGTFLLSMGTGKLFHFFARFRMATETNGPQVIY